MSASPRSLVTVAMIAIGGLVVALFGLATAYVWIAAGSDLVRLGGHGEVAAYDRAFLKASLVVGLLPALAGALILWLGLRRRWREIRPPRAAPPPG